jgi:hypothetical protein
MYDKFKTMLSHPDILTEMKSSQGFLDHSIDNLLNLYLVNQDLANTFNRVGICFM